MSLPTQKLIEGVIIGDYHLKQMISAGDTTQTWDATQISVSRDVIVDSLNIDYQKDEEIVSTFLIDVRTKAQVDHPLIGAVFEAIREENICIYTREKIAGKTLQQSMDEGETMTPLEVLIMLKQIADANVYLEKHDIATLPTTPDQIYITGTNLCRCVNMAIGGPKDPQVAIDDKAMLADSFKKIMLMGQPGATRATAILQAMEGETSEGYIRWDQIHQFSEEITQQIGELETIANHRKLNPTIDKRTQIKRIIIYSAAALGVLLVGITLHSIYTQEQVPEARDLKGEIEVKGGQFVSFDRKLIKLQRYHIDAHEVTIAEYATFLSQFTQLDESKHGKFQHSEHPSYKNSHHPEDWKNLYKAAQSNELWKGKVVTLNHPVVGIDWWDAYTFASFYNRHLPTLDEWLKSIKSSDTQSSALSASEWGPVDQESSDITKNNIHGLAGNVSEWSADLSTPIHDPTAQKRPVVIGAAHNNKAEGATKREWINRDNPRDTRRDNLGFRTVKRP